MQNSFSLYFYILDSIAIALTHNHHRFSVSEVVQIRLECAAALHNTVFNVCIVSDVNLV